MQIRCTQADHKNEQITGFCIDCTCQNQRPYCHFCLPSHGQHLNKLTSQELLFEWVQERTLMVQNVQKNVQECKIALDSLINLCLPYYNFNIQQFPELGLSQVDQLIKGLCQTGDCEEKLFKQLKQSIEQIKLIVDEIQNKVKNQTNIKKNDHFQIQHCYIDKQILEQPKYQYIVKPNLNPFTFRLMNQYSIKQTEQCYAVAINKDCSIVVAGCKQKIKIYQFKQGMLKLNQVLHEHKSDVTTLNFMKQSNQLISGDEGGSILIWQYNNNSWICSQTIKGHSDCINCLILNNNEDLFISCSDDKTIKFWVKENEWINQQIISDHTNLVYQISLNEQQNQVISCGLDSFILVIEYSECNKKWILKSQIQVNCFGFRLCFISNDQFTFQPDGNLMNVFEMNSVSKQFTKTKDITLNEGYDNYQLFPQQFIRQKQLLVNKHQKNVNLIRKTQNGEFKVEQSIQFNTDQLYGQLSDNGEYLITWDGSSKEIQIRRYTEE